MPEDKMALKSKKKRTTFELGRKKTILNKNRCEVLSKKQFEYLMATRKDSTFSFLFVFPNKKEQYKKIFQGIC